MNVIQFKLSNNDELICEVVEEPGEEDVNLIVRNALQIITYDDPGEGIRMYSFRPWMIYQDQESFLQLLNMNHIIGEAKPSDMLLAQYRKALDNEQKNSKAKEEEINERMEQIREAIRDALSLDSDQASNVISFNKKRLH